MHHHRNERSDRRGSRHDRSCEEHDCERDERQGGERGSGPDTSFLQLEMSKVLYGEAESISKKAFRELLLEAAKKRWQERFGDIITGLAELAVDELLEDVIASLEIEERIDEHNQGRRRSDERLRNIFGGEEDDHDHHDCSDHDHDHDDDEHDEE